MSNTGVQKKDWTQQPFAIGKIYGLLLTAFNLVPAFPLDGGRALRAILWRLSGDYARATQHAANCGRVLAYGLLLLGVAIFFAYSFVAGSIIGVVGWRLKDMLARIEPAVGPSELAPAP